MIAKTLNFTTTADISEANGCLILLRDLSPTTARVKWGLKMASESICQQLFVVLS